MRIHGTLTRWNDDRGFGFITPAKGPPDIFVHISEFPREGGRPSINELISFEVVPGPDGKQRAVRVMRPGQKARGSVSRERKQPQGRWVSGAITILMVLALGAYGYSRFTHRTAPAEEIRVPEQVQQPSLPASPAAPAPTALAAERTLPLETTPQPQPASRYSCDGRTMCSQMKSCEEATYFIRNCPNTKMDGNNDGVPCESQWCK
jgi:cold shock CspA family protein